MRKKFKEDNIRDINEREYDYTMGTIYIDMINECEKLGDYVVNVVQARFGK
jgi:phosphate:Na+ symporter